MPLGRRAMVIPLSSELMVEKIVKLTPGDPGHEGRTTSVADGSSELGKSRRSQTDPPCRVAPLESEFDVLNVQQSLKRNHPSWEVEIEAPPQGGGRLWSHCTETAAVAPHGARRWSRWRTGRSLRRTFVRKVPGLQLSKFSIRQFLNWGTSPPFPTNGLAELSPSVLPASSIQLFAASFLTLQSLAPSSQRESHLLRRSTPHFQSPPSGPPQS
jgi:hypothetical protein